MKQITKEQAVRFYESGVWQDMTAKQKVEMQLFQDRLAMPFSEFHEAMESVLGRTVYTHEFANRDSLQKRVFRRNCPADIRGNHRKNTGRKTDDYFCGFGKLIYFCSCLTRPPDWKPGCKKVETSFSNKALMKARALGV